MSGGRWLTKEDWIDILRATSNRDWADWVVIAFAIISPLITLAAVVFAAKSAIAAEKAANLSLKMYKEQKEEQEKSFLPLFTLDGWTYDDKSSIHFKLINKNTNPISFIKADSKIQDFEYLHLKQKDELSFSIYQNFNEKKDAVFFVYYDALNHQRYKSEVKVSLTDEIVLLENQKNIKEF